jgi:hypothetical protein
VKANWKLLLAIAEAACGDWKQRAWRAAGAIEQIKEGFEPSLGVRLLQAMQAMFKHNIDCLLSKAVIAKLIEDPEQPWVEYKNGKPITQKQLAGLLGQYRIYSGTVHPDGHPDGKGYKRQQFEEAWERYLGEAPGFSNSEASNRPNADVMGTSHNFSSVPETSWDGSKNANLSNNDAGWDGWTDRKAGNGGDGEFGVTPAGDCQHTSARADNLSDVRIFPPRPPTASERPPNRPQYCDYCRRGPGINNPVGCWDWNGRTVSLHPRRQELWVDWERAAEVRSSQ